MQILQYLYYQYITSAIAQNNISINASLADTYPFLRCFLVHLGAIQKNINFCSLLQYNTVKCTVMHAENPHLKGKMENNWQPCSSHNPIQPQRARIWLQKSVSKSAINMYKCYNLCLNERANMRGRFRKSDMSFLDRKMATPLNHIWNDAFHINQWTMRLAGFNITLFDIVSFHYETNSVDSAAHGPCNL